jgi:hypothetical protein
MLFSIKDQNDNTTTTISREDKGRTNWGSCICVLGVSILPFSAIVIFDFIIVPTLWYFFILLLSSEQIVTVIPITSRNRNKYYVDYATQIATSEGSNNLSPLKLWVRTSFIARCTWCNIMSYSLSFTCDRSLVFIWYSGFLHQ